MPLYRPSELRAFLQSIEKAPRRFSSQRFLIDGNTVDRIVNTVSFFSEETIIEIGPGPGVLTEALLAAGHRVVAVEKDPDFAHALRRFETPALHVVESDVLRCCVSELLALHGSSTCAIVSNLPYHLTTEIIEWILKAKAQCTGAVLMLQKEAAHRLASGKGGALPLFLAHCGGVRLVQSVSRNCFWPKPMVDSAVISFKTSSLNDIDEGFLPFLSSLFVHRRKGICSALASQRGRSVAEAALTICEILPMTRPEALAVEQCYRLFRAIS